MTLSSCWLREFAGQVNFVFPLFCPSPKRNDPLRGNDIYQSNIIKLRGVITDADDWAEVAALPWKIVMEDTAKEMR